MMCFFVWRNKRFEKSHKSQSPIIQCLFFIIFVISRSHSHMSNCPESNNSISSCESTSSKRVLSRFCSWRPWITLKLNFERSATRLVSSWFCFFCKVSAELTWMSFCMFSSVNWLGSFVCIKAWRFQLRSTEAAVGVTFNIFVAVYDSGFLLWNVLNQDAWSSQHPIWMHAKRLLSSSWIHRVLRIPASESQLQRTGLVIFDAVQQWTACL